MKERRCPSCRPCCRRSVRRRAPAAEASDGGVYRAGHHIPRVEALAAHFTLAYDGELDRPVGMPDLKEPQLGIADVAAAAHAESPDLLAPTPCR